MQAKTILTVLLISVGIAFQSCKRNNPVVPKSEQTVPKIEDILRLKIPWLGRVTK